MFTKRAWILAESKLKTPVALTLQHYPVAQFGLEFLCLLNFNESCASEAPLKLHESSL